MSHLPWTIGHSTRPIEEFVVLLKVPFYHMTTMRFLCSLCLIKAWTEQVWTVDQRKEKIGSTPSER